MASTKKKGMTQMKIGNFFTKEKEPSLWSTLGEDLLEKSQMKKPVSFTKTTKQELPKSKTATHNVVQDAADVIPASPHSIPRGKISLARNSSRKSSLCGTGSRDNCLTLNGKCNSLNRNVESLGLDPSPCTGGSSRYNKMSPVAADSAKSISKSARKESCGTTATSVAAHAGSKQSSTALSTNLNNRKSLVNNKQCPIFIEDGDGPRLDECKPEKDQVCPERFTDSAKLTPTGHGTKRLSCLGSSGFSPLKKKHALSLEETDDNICKQKFGSSSIGKESSNRRYQRKSSSESFRMETYLDADKTIKKWPEDKLNGGEGLFKGRGKHEDVLEGSKEDDKLQRSLKISKKSAKKLSSLSRHSGVVSRIRYTSKSSCNSIEVFSDYEFQGNMQSDYLKKEVSCNMNLAEGRPNMDKGGPNRTESMPYKGEDHTNIGKGNSVMVSSRPNMTKVHPNMVKSHPIMEGVHSKIGNNHSKKTFTEKFLEQENSAAEGNCGSMEDNEIDGDICNAFDDSFSEFIPDFELFLTEQAASKLCKGKNKELARKNVELEGKSVELGGNNMELDGKNDDSKADKDTDFNDSFMGIDLDDDIDVTDLTLTQDMSGKVRNFTVKPRLVLEVLRREEEGGRNNVFQKNLRLFDEETSQESSCVLKGDWEAMTVLPGDLVHITGDNTALESPITLDNSSKRYLIIFPHTLVSGTTISMGITCQRRAVLSELFKTDGPNEVMILGTFLHELFDFVIKEKVFDKKRMERKTQELLSQSSYLNTLYSLNIDSKNFMGRVRDMLTGVCSWAKKFLKPEPHISDDLVDFKLGSEPDVESDVRLAIADVVDIEENVLCPSLGLKGKIDASVNVKIHRNRKTKIQNSFEEMDYLLPMELKTGKMFSKLGSIEHRAQVILYTLMMSEKYNSDIEAGLLYYMRTGHLQGVPATEREKRSLIIKRNEIARFLSIENQRNDASVPGLLQNERTCQRCPVAGTCMVFHKSVEQGNEETSGVGKLFDDCTGHLTEKEMKYFVKWFHLIMLEAHEEAISSGKRKIWMKTSKEREDGGKCFKEMIIKSEIQQDKDLWSYVFAKSDGDNCDVSLTDISIFKGDRIMISEENCKTFGLCFGYIENVTFDKLHIWCSEKIRPRPGNNKTLYRIEKDDTLSSHKIPLGNLMKLFLSRDDADNRLRELVIGLAPPQFDLSETKSFLEDLCTRDEDGQRLKTFYKEGQQYFISETQISTIRSVYKGLNPDQKEAVASCLSAKDYVMILGMPGTGKTTTIACIVSILVSLGKSVLITSYTHSAVDNILMKIKQMKLDFVRLGQQHKVHDEIKPYIVENATRNIKTVEGLDHFYRKKSIVATTCLGTNHPLFMKKKFDFCFVDEASQITQPVCFGAIRCASTFILVGDNYQLPPLVQSVEARNSGMDVSLFKLLSEKNPSAIVSLRYQYRMHRDIMLLANDLIYGHRMQCGTNATSTRLLQLPRLKECHGGIAPDTFISRIIAPSQPVVFINSDSIPCPESTTGNHIHNENEAKIVARILEKLVECGVGPDHVGIVSPLRQQLKTIECKLKETCGSVVASNVEMNTVDKYQGRDKSCIIISFVRSNSSGNLGELLKDWRRINVAITRAKHKIIMIGSKETLSFSPVLKRLIALIESKHWLIQGDCSFLDNIEGAS